MMDTIQVSSMTKTYSTFLKNQEMLAKARQGGSFTRELLEKYESMGKTSELADIMKVSPQDMTMEEYKKYIRGTISQIPLHPSQSGWLWNIQITEEGYEAMKNDPEYEAYVLDAIRANFSFNDPWRNKSWGVLHFGATKEECYGESFSMGSSIKPEKEKTYWEQRQEKRKRMKEQLDKFMEKRRLQAKEWQETLIQRKLYYEAVANMGWDEKAVWDDQMVRADAVAFFDANILVGGMGKN